MLDRPMGTSVNNKPGSLLLRPLPYLDLFNVFYIHVPKLVAFLALLSGIWSKRGEWCKTALPVCLRSGCVLSCETAPSTIFHVWPSSAVKSTATLSLEDWLAFSSDDVLEVKVLVSDGTSLNGSLKNRK